jgi:hypothetical protein
MAQDWATKLPKLLRIVHSNKRAYPKVFVGSQEMMVVRYHADSDAHGGSTVTLTFPSDHVEWELEE